MIFPPLFRGERNPVNCVRGNGEAGTGVQGRDETRRVERLGKKAERLSHRRTKTAFSSYWFVVVNSP